ncbi:uncharacterized protein [Amphiura filiformis]|uniref:uncharacterized protein n=1 Tax=Amphiura filiformis TaxID=82378 RepID=UPI003B210F5A
MDDETEALIGGDADDIIDDTVGDGEAEEEQQEESGEADADKKKIRQSKSYTTAKTLNDREQRMLRVKLEFYDKEFKVSSHKINVEQAALKRELRHINPDIQDDPDKGFFVPAGMTREEAEKLRDNKRNNAKKPTRSISLEEFDAMRRVRSEAVRKTIEALQANHIIEKAGENGDLQQRRKSRAIPPPKIHAVSFTTMAKVVGSTINVEKASKNKKKQQMADVVELVGNANKLHIDKRKLVDMVKKSKTKTKDH